jgi:hypothetical protein
MKNCYQVTVDVEVTDVGQLLRAATQKALEDGMTLDETSQMLFPGGDLDIAACVLCLADPGLSWPGTHIHDCEVATLGGTP